MPTSAQGKILYLQPRGAGGCNQQNTAKLSITLALIPALCFLYMNISPRRNTVLTIVSRLNYSFSFCRHKTRKLVATYFQLTPTLLGNLLHLCCSRYKREAIILNPHKKKQRSGLIGVLIKLNLNRNTSLFNRKASERKT